jgi:hypothetical protein
MVAPVNMGTHISADGILSRIYSDVKSYPRDSDDFMSRVRLDDIIEVAVEVEKE